MTLQQTLQRIEACGTAQNRKVYRRHCAGENLFGVSFADLGKLQKEIKSDHSLALALWRSGNEDARQLAMMIADPDAATVAQIEAWSREVTGFTSGALAGFAGRTPHARALCDAWRDDADAWRSCMGWMIAAHLAMESETLADSYFAALLKVIAAEIHARRNWVRGAMNSALIAIGQRNEALERLALVAAKRIGPVEVDHGETGCKTPDAAAYIIKSRDRSRKRREARAAKARPFATRKKSGP